jgi:hypothetical protein
MGLSADRAQRRLSGQTIAIVAFIVGSACLLGLHQFGLQPLYAEKELVDPTFNAATVIAAVPSTVTRHQQVELNNPTVETVTMTDAVKPTLPDGPVSSSTHSGSEKGETSTMKVLVPIEGALNPETHALVKRALQSKGSPVQFRSDGCSSLTKPVVVSTKEGLFFHGYSGTSTVTIPTCSIAAVKAHPYEYPSSLPSTLAKEIDGQSCDAIVLISQIERPQHAAHCMWSIISVLALQMEAGLDYRTTAVHLTIMTYGVFENWSDYLNRKKFPHIELFQILSKRFVGIYRDQNVRRVMVDPQLWDPDTTALVQKTGRPPKGDGPAVAKQELVESSTFCYGSAIVGNIPMRIPRVSVKTELEPKHFIEFRRRLIEYFKLQDWGPTPAEQVIPKGSPFDKPYMLLISRVKQKRRLILNKDDIAAMVQERIGVIVKEIDWEGMSLRDQLQLAINAVGMIGTHGNGMAWAPFMPQGSAMVELGSKVSKRNEVKVGKNQANSANIAEWCGLKALSIRCDFVENAFSKKTSPTRVWKEVDIRVSKEQLDEIAAFLTPWKVKK